MKMKSILTAAVLTSVSFLAQANEKVKDSPECASVTKSCESAGFTAGSHKTNHKGLWVDCVAKLAKGETVEGVSGVSKEDASKCVELKKQKRAEKSKK